MRPPELNNDTSLSQLYVFYLFDGAILLVLRDVK